MMNMAPAKAPRENSCIDMAANHVADLETIRVVLASVLNEVRGIRPEQIHEDASGRPTLVDNLLNADRLTQEIRSMAEELRERFTSSKASNVGFSAGDGAAGINVAYRNQIIG